MIRWTKGNIFESSVHVIVNDVYCIGGERAIKKPFRDTFPAMYLSYRIYCQRPGLQKGKFHLWKGADKWILNFPVKNRWCDKVDLSYISTGLNNLKKNARRMGIKSLAFPKLGCSGIHKLDWTFGVKPVMENILHDMDMDIWIYE